MLSARIEGELGSVALRVELDTGSGPLVIVGPNGAGKTTLLRMLLGALPVRAGRITLGETVLYDSSASVCVALEARQLGYVPQDYALFPHLSARQNVEFALGSRRPELSRAERRARAETLLARLQLAALADRNAAQLSGGEKQRVALARALAAEPRALLLDEPLSALDIDARRDVRELLRATLHELSLPCLIVTHDREDALRLGTRIAVLEAGRITQLGTWAQLTAAPATRFVQAFVREPAAS
ncbi:MAG TPA: ABC transporter ATP-binding protein [Polyangiales bacterium]|nr:ABC transporter ATP-binding protein [Polyangiales bacterium]